MKQYELNFPRFPSSLPSSLSLSLHLPGSSYYRGTWGFHTGTPDTETGSPAADRTGLVRANSSRPVVGRREYCGSGGAGHLGAPSSPPARSSCRAIRVEAGRYERSKSRKKPRCIELLWNERLIRLEDAVLQPIPAISAVYAPKNNLENLFKHYDARRRSHFAEHLRCCYTVRTGERASRATSERHRGGCLLPPSIAPTGTSGTGAGPAKQEKGDETENQKQKMRDTFRQGYFESVQSRFSMPHQCRPNN